METAVPTINTLRLRPFCQRTSRTVMSIHENGDVSMEILAKPKSGSQEGIQIVQESVFVTGDGQKMQVYQNNQELVGEDGQETKSAWTCQEFNIPKLPPKQLKKYNHVLRFVELVRSRTPKIILITDKAKCKLMENTPADFQVDFFDETSMLLSKRKLQVTDADGNIMTSDLGNLSHDLPSNIAQKFHYLQQCMSECIHLESSFDILQTNGASHEYFPVTVGTNTSPVIIPTRSMSDFSLNLHASENRERHVCSERQGVTQDSYPFLSKDCRNMSSSQYKESSENISSSESSQAPKNKNISFIASPFSISSINPIDLNYSLQQNLEQLKYPEMSHIQHNIKDGAISSEFYTTHLNQDYIEKITDENQISSVPSSVEGFHHSCCPENVASVFHDLSLSEEYNKQKYCSEARPYEDHSDGENLISKPELVKGEVYLKHENLSNQLACDYNQVPFSMNGTNSSYIGTTDLVSQPQSLPSTESINSSFSIPSINPSFSDGSICQRTETGSKRNSIASSSSSFFSGIETSSNPIIKEILDKDEILNFTPVQSSSLVTSSSNSDHIQIHKKMHRKVASPNIPLYLENQIECLDINGQQVSDKVVQEDCKAAKEEDIAESVSFYDVQSTLNRRPGSLNLTNSVSATYVKKKSRQDLFNRSLPLWHDTKQIGHTNFPMSPQKQFLQSSDCDQGHLDYSLPPQVRNSLDLSTSSNYSDSPSSSQSSSCEPLYQVFVPYTGWASYYASGAVWVLYNDGTQIGVKASEKAMTFIDQDGTQKKFSNKDIVPDIVKMKLEKLPYILETVLQGKR